MSAEQKSQKEPIRFTRGEFDAIANLRPSNLAGWMEQHGIEFSPNPILITIDGEEFLMQTSEEDWGTVSKNTPEQSQ